MGRQRTFPLLLRFRRGSEREGQERPSRGAFPSPGLRRRRPSRPDGAIDLCRRQAGLVETRLFRVTRFLQDASRPPAPQDRAFAERRWRRNRGLSLGGKRARGGLDPGTEPASSSAGQPRRRGGAARLAAGRRRDDLRSRRQRRRRSRTLDGDLEYQRGVTAC